MSSQQSSAKAIHNNIRISPQKLNALLWIIRGKSASVALNNLTFSRKRIAEHVKNCLESAIANAENNYSLDPDILYVSEAWVGKGLVMKRFRARARGRGARIIKPFSKLTIIVKEKKMNKKEITDGPQN